MQPTPSLPTGPETPNGSVKPDSATWWSVAKNTLSGLKGWQAVSAAVIAFYCFLGIFGPILAPFEPYRGTVATRLCPPLAIEELTTSTNAPSRAAACSSRHILGTDQIGRDIFSRLLHGTRTSFSIVASSVLIGLIVGVTIAVLINGLRPTRRLIAYLIVGTTVVPSGFFLVNQPEIFAIFDLITLFSLATIAVALLIMGVAYQFDNRCQPHWFNQIGVERRTHECCSLFLQQVVALGPWIALAVVASAALIIPRAIPAIHLTSAVSWSLEHEYLFEHIGMFSPIVPMTIVPIAFVSFGAWWFVRHLLGRFNPSSKPTFYATPITEVLAEELSSDNEGINPSVEAASRMTKRRWILTIIGLVAAITITRFVVAEAVPISRELAQDWTGEYQSTLSLSVQGRREALDCANELSSRLMTLRGQPPEQLEVEPSGRCLDLYHRYRNAPTHRMTFEYALNFLSQSLTLALIGSIVTAVVWTAIPKSARALRRMVHILIVLVALTGLTMTFAHLGWLLVVERWINPVDLALSVKGLAVSRALAIVRDFSVALGISYLTIAIASPSLGFGNAVRKIDVLYNWASNVVPCVLLTTGLLIVFHYRFPTNLLFYDTSLAVIANPTQEHVYISTDWPFSNWLWTYWFALIGYAAIVLGFFVAAIWGFRRLVRNDVNGVDSTVISPDSPSQDADPI